MAPAFPVGDPLGPLAVELASALRAAVAAVPLATGLVGAAAVDATLALAVVLLSTGARALSLLGRMESPLLGFPAVPLPAGEVWAGVPRPSDFMLLLQAAGEEEEEEEGRWGGLEARRGRCVGGLSDGDAGPEAHFTRLCYGSREREIARKREIMRERQE